jgi:hypothetical protein
MCPASISSAAVVAVVSATSAGGVVALVVKKFHVIKRAFGWKDARR